MGQGLLPIKLGMERKSHPFGTSTCLNQSVFSFALFFPDFLLFVQIAMQNILSDSKCDLGNLKVKRK